MNKERAALLRERINAVRLLRRKSVASFKVQFMDGMAITFNKVEHIEALIEYSKFLEEKSIKELEGND